MSEVRFRTIVLAETTSTNDEVKRALAAGEPEGLVVRARQQSGGYGRQGRTWASPVGGLYQSMLLRPQVSVEVLPTLSPVISIAVRRALAGLVSKDNAAHILIKWPNDVVVFAEGQRAGAEGQQADAGDRHTAYHKLCGISLEVHAGGVCIGAGVNVHKPVADAVGRGASIEGKNVPIYLSELGFSGSIDDVGDAILREFAPLYAQWYADGFASLLDEYNAHAYLTNRHVLMVDREGSPLAEGTVSRIDEHGRLVLVDEAAVEVPVTSGEAHVV